MPADHHLPFTRRGIENRQPEPEVAWTNLPPGVTAVPVDHRAELEAALAESVHTAALSIDYAATHSTVQGVVTAAQLNAEGYDAEHLRQLIGCLAVCLRRAHQHPRSNGRAT